MRVVFAYQKWSGEFKLWGHFSRRNATWQPLGLCLLAACVKQAGHETFILDGEVNQWGTERMAKEVTALKPDIVGISAYSPFFHLSADLAAAIKRINKDIPIAGGGPHFTIQKEEALLPQFDYVFMGEAERSLPAFLEAYQSFDPFPPGIIYRKRGKIINTGPAQWVTERSTKGADVGQFYPLDEFPFPARHLLSMEKYRLGTLHGRKHFTSIATMRGCPWR